MPVTRKAIAIGALSRVCKQLNDDVSLILVHKDESTDFIDRFNYLFPKAIPHTLHVFEPEMEGNPHRARVTGLSMATGTFTHFLDDDDYIPGDWYESIDWSEGDFYWSLSAGIVGVPEDYIGFEARTRLTKTNPSCMIYRTEHVRKVFDIIPEDIPPYIEPFLYFLVNQYENQPHNIVLDSGVLRGMRGDGTDWGWMDMNKVREEHYDCWYFYLSKDRLAGLPYPLGEYYEIYRHGVGPWGLERLKRLREQ